MSKSTLSALKSEINTESKKTDSTILSLTDLDRSISRAMEDRVGNSARESIKCICNAISYNADKLFSAANGAVSYMENGFTNIGNQLSESKRQLSLAKSIVNGLGEV